MSGASGRTIYLDLGLAVGRWGQEGFRLAVFCLAVWNAGEAKGEVEEVLACTLLSVIIMGLV